MQNEPKHPDRFQQNNQDNSTGIQADVQGGTSYFAREIHIHNGSLSTTDQEGGAAGSEPPHNIPPSNAARFLGRDHELAQLHELLQQGNVIAVADSTGEGGVGKTELAIQYCLKHLSEYPGGICWMYPKTSDIGTQVVEFARVQFLKVQVPEGVSLSGQVAFCWRNWCAGASLLVIDNVTATEYEQLKSYLPLNAIRFKVLLTTRERLRVPLQLPLGVLKRPDSIKLAETLLGEVLVQQDAEFVEKLCARVGDSPLALHMIAGFIKPEVVTC